MVPEGPQDAVGLAEGAVYEALAEPGDVEREDGVVLHEALLVACEEAEEGEDEGCGAEQRGDQRCEAHGGCCA